MRFKKKKLIFYMVHNDFIFLKKLLNVLIKKGKKEKALKFVLTLLKNLKKTQERSFHVLDIIYQSIQNVKPILYLQKLRKSSKLFYLPDVITNEKKLSLSLRWIIKSVNARKEKKIGERLTAEFLDCFNSKGLSMAKKQTVYKTIKSGRPFFNLLRYK